MITWLIILGLLLDVIGVVLLVYAAHRDFRYILQTIFYQINIAHYSDRESTGEQINGKSPNEFIEDLINKRKSNNLIIMGAIILVVGFILQIIGNLF